MNMPIHISTITSFTYSLLGHLHYYIAAVRQLKPYVGTSNKCTVLFGLERSDYMFSMSYLKLVHMMSLGEGWKAQSSLAPATNRIQFITHCIC